MTDQTAQTENQDAVAAAVAVDGVNPQTRRVWLVPHPTHQFVENVKAIARNAGLEVVDIAVAGAAEIERATAFPPQLTLLADVVPAQNPAAPAAAAAHGLQSVDQAEATSGTSTAAAQVDGAAASGDATATNQVKADTAEPTAAKAPAAAKADAGVTKPRKGGPQ